MSYLLWLFVFIWLPTFILWLFNFSLLWRYKKILIYAMIGALSISIPWDILAISNHIWYFPKQGIVGIYLGIIPLEEYLYMTTVTLFVASVVLIFREKKNR